MGSWNVSNFGNDGMPDLVDSSAGFIPPPAGATYGGHPDTGIHSAFPGHGHGFNGNSNPGTPNVHPTTPSWANPTAGLPSWAAPQSASLQWTHGQYQPSPNYGTAPLSAPAHGGGNFWPTAQPGPSSGFSNAHHGPPSGFSSGGGWGAPSPSAPIHHSIHHSSSWAGTPFPQHHQQLSPVSPVGSGGFASALPGGHWTDGFDAGTINHFPSLSLSRSNSHGRSPKRRSSMHKRSNSFSGPTTMHHPDVYAEDNLARRPRDWRADYSARPGIISMITPFTNRSDVKEIQDPIKRSLHNLLNYTPTQPPILHDLREDPLLPHTIKFPHLGRTHNNLDFAQMATSPPTNFMRIYHQRLPWYIDVPASHPNGVTIYDVITQIHAQLMLSVSGRHFYNEDLDNSDRKLLTRAFQERSQGRTEVMSRGILRVDFLGMDRKLILLGLMRGKNGMWEMKTRRLD